MCRNIKKLRHPENPPTDEELRDAALQFVRKISGYHKPSRANEEAFDQAVGEIAGASRRLFESLVVRPPARATRPPAATSVIGPPAGGPSAAARSP